MKGKNPELAVKSYQKAISLDPENAQAWSNLATSFLQIGSRDLAYKALQEAQRNTFDNWQIMDNFVYVASQIGHVADAIETYHRLLDVKPKHLNYDCLKSLVNHVVENQFDALQCPSTRHRSRLVVLFGRVTSMITNDVNVWELFAKLLVNSDKDSDRHKGLLHMQKAHSIVKQDSNWNKQPETLLKIVEFTCHFVQISIDVIVKDLNGLVNFALVSSIKLSVSSILKASKDMLEDFKDIKMPNENLSIIVTNLDVLFERFMNECFNPIQKQTQKKTTSI